MVSCTLDMKVSDRNQKIPPGMPPTQLAKFQNVAAVVLPDNACNSQTGSARFWHIKPEDMRAR